MDHRSSLVALSLLSLIGIGTGCAGDVDDDNTTSDDELRKGSAEQWVYNGTLPHLDDPSITVSLTAHTARVTGFLPAGWSQPLPYYADKLVEGGRTKIAVVYPIATGSSVNSQGTSYEINHISPWVPSNSDATWGGFPFIPYNRGIAFHGPITAADGQWKLLRGAVSHGCNRMKGEHVVELANLIGADMTTHVHSGASLDGFDVPVTVLRKADEWNGQLVDVDYPTQGGVTRPAGNVKMFAAWNADQLAAFVCPLKKQDLGGSRTIPEGYCAKRNRNAFDPAVGPR